MSKVAVKALVEVMVVRLRVELLELTRQLLRVLVAVEALALLQVVLKPTGLSGVEVKVRLRVVLEVTRLLLRMLVAVEAPVMLAVIPEPTRHLLWVLVAVAGTGVVPEVTRQRLRVLVAVDALLLLVLVLEPPR